jgi:hypothetical protein
VVQGGFLQGLIHEVGEMIRYIAENSCGKHRFLNKEFKIYELEGLFIEIAGINPLN